MAKLLKLLLTYKFRSAKLAHKNRGFTLIELLVGLILAFLIITPLLGFVVNMLQTDRQEQAKATSEQEIQAALDYITRDMEQAVYIYDGYGLSQIQANLPQLANSTPVLVFWKRQIIRDILPTAETDKKDDAFVYSLVAYYVRNNKDDPNCAQSTWSCTAQILRYQFTDAVKVKTGTGAVTTIKDAEPSGFQIFNPDKMSLEEVMMNTWRPGVTLGGSPEVLIDYVDQSPLTQSCPPVQRNKLPPGIADATTYNNSKYQQVPLATAGKTPIAGFFACVDLENTAAKVTIRGNALARIRRKTQPPQYVANSNYAMSYFPSASVQVEGRGVFRINQKN